jgi:hypothetical protein
VEKGMAASVAYLIQQLVADKLQTINITRRCNIYTNGTNSQQFIMGDWWSSGQRC